MNKDAHINIFYLKDKVVENRVLHERFEALSVLQRQKHQPCYELMLRQLVDRLPALIIESEPLYLPVIDEVIKLFCSFDNIPIVD